MINLSIDDKTASDFFRGIIAKKKIENKQALDNMYGTLRTLSTSSVHVPILLSQIKEIEAYDEALSVIFEFECPKSNK